MQPAPLQRGGGRYRLNPVATQSLESARFQPLNLSSGFLVSKFAFSNSTCTATARRERREEAEAAHEKLRRLRRAQDAQARAQGGAVQVELC